MVERGRGGAATEGGFTLLEILVAIGVLVVGVTSLLGLLQFGVSTRRSAELRARAVLVAEDALRDAEQRLLAAAAIDPEWGEYPEAEQLAIATETVEEVPGQPGLRYTIEFTPDAERPGLLLVTVRVGWLESGAEIDEVFQRLVMRAAPFPARVATRREAWGGR